MTQGTHESTFSENGIRRYYKDRFFQTILNFDINNESDTEKLTGVRYTKFRTYPSKEYAERCLTSGDYGGAISLIILNTGQICISCKDNKNHTTILIETDDRHGSVYCESWVTTISFGAAIKHTRLELMDSSIVMAHGLALPMPSGSDENKFYITTDDWKERAFVKKEIVYILPRAFDCQY